MGNLKSGRCRLREGSLARAFHYIIKSSLNMVSQKSL